MKVFADITYEHVSEDLSPECFESDNMQDEEYVKKLHKKLDEWLQNSDGKGEFKIKCAEDWIPGVIHEELK